MDEKQLIEKCLEKANGYDRILFDAYYQIIYKKVYRYLSNHHDTEDVTIVIFNKVFKNLASFEFRGDGSFRKWISTITIHEALNFLRRKQPIDFLGEKLELLDKIPDEEVAELDTLSVQMIMSIVEKMPQGYKTIFIMHLIEGLTHQEISEVLGISRNTSKSQMLKAKKYILKELKIKNHGR